MAITKPNSPTSSPGLRTTAVLLAVIFVLYLAREILIPLAFAITLALILSPAVAWLQKVRVGRVTAVNLVMVVALAAAGGIAWMIFNQLVGVANELPRYQENIHRKLESMRAPGSGALGRAAESIRNLARDLTEVPDPNVAPGSAESGTRPLPVEIVEKPANELVYARNLAGPFLAPLAEFGIVLIFTVFILIKQKDLRNRLFRLAGLDRLNVMTQALDDATKRVSRYLVMQLLVNAGFGFACGLGLYVIGIPYAPLWGALAGILRIVPYVGAIASVLPPLLLALAVYDDWIAPLAVFVLFATLEIVTGNVVEPWLFGIHTGISALALLLTTVCWAILWGPEGLILSTPLTVCVFVLGRYVPQFSFLYVLLGDEAALNPEARFYQRLLAFDDQEAKAVATLYISQNSLQQLYDSVLIPALTMAEQDRHKGALDATREEFLFMSVKEMVVEFSERTLAQPAATRPSASTGRVFCVPANDEADEITAAMLAQLLEQAGYSAISFSLDDSMQTAVTLMDPGEHDTFCISALPPFAFAKARTLSQELQQRFPSARVLIGVWGFTGDTERALKRFQPSLPSKLVTSLAGAVKFVADPKPAVIHNTESAALAEMFVEEPLPAGNPAPESR